MDEYGVETGGGWGETGATSTAGVPGTNRLRGGGGGGGLSINGATTHPTSGPIQGGGDKFTERTAVTLLRCPRDASAARPAATNGGTCTRTGHSVVNDDTQSAGGRGGRGAPQGGAPMRRKVSEPERKAHWTPQGKREARNRGGRGWKTPPPPATSQQENVHTRGGAALSTEEGADLQGFTPAGAHLSLWEVYEEALYQNGGMHLLG